MCRYSRKIGVSIGGSDSRNFAHLWVKVSLGLELPICHRNSSPCTEPEPKFIVIYGSESQLWRGIQVSSGMGLPNHMLYEMSSIRLAPQVDELGT
jgi:hypothetical protein